MKKLKQYPFTVSQIVSQQYSDTQSFLKLVCFEGASLKLILALSCFRAVEKLL